MLKAEAAGLYPKLLLCPQPSHGQHNFAMLPRGVFRGGSEGTTATSSKHQRGFDQRGSAERTTPRGARQVRRQAASGTWYLRFSPLRRRRICLKNSSSLPHGESAHARSLLLEKAAFRSRCACYPWSESPIKKSKYQRRVPPRMLAL